MMTTTRMTARAAAGPEGGTMTTMMTTDRGGAMTTVPGGATMTGLEDAMTRADAALAAANRMTADAPSFRRERPARWRLAAKRGSCYDRVCGSPYARVNSGSDGSSQS